MARMNTDKKYQPSSDQPEGADYVRTKEPKQAKKNRRRSTTADVVEAVGSWLGGALLIAIAAACIFGPAYVSEMREDEIMSVLDLSDEALADTSMGDLIDTRKYVDEYKSRDEVNRRAAEKAGAILDEAIADRIK